jgi:hypothetical protein
MANTTHDVVDSSTIHAEVLLFVSLDNKRNERSSDVAIDGALHDCKALAIPARTKAEFTS